MKNAEIYQIPVNRIDGSATSLSEYEGKVMLIVNVASKCGLTPQYDGLEKLYEKYQSKGFVVLGFPANEFGAQEPGTNQEIQQFCQMKFGVKFPMFSKIIVKGEGQHPLYQLLTERAPSRLKKSTSLLGKALAVKSFFSKEKSEILWNFEKFLIDRSGKVAARFAPDLDPMDPLIVNKIESTL